MSKMDKKSTLDISIEEALKKTSPTRTYSDEDNRYPGVKKKKREKKLLARYQVYFEEAQSEKIEAEAAQNGMSVSSYLRKIILEHIR
jgi:hypothetical protein